MSDEYQLRKDIDSLFDYVHRTKLAKFDDNSELSNMTIDEILDNYELKEVFNIIITMENKIIELDGRVTALEEK